MSRGGGFQLQDQAMTPLQIAVEALKDIARGRPELDDWGDCDPQRLAKAALRRIHRVVKKRRR